MVVEFISLTFPNSSTELAPVPGAQLDRDYLVRYARSLEDAGFDYTLLPYHTGNFDPFTIGAAISQHTDRLRPIIALRPNTVYPTVAANALTTLDQLSSGRAVVHFVSGGSTQEQEQEGDFLSKAERYERTAEYIAIVRRVWQGGDPFDHEGKYYRFTGYNSIARPVNGTIPVSFGGSSPEAYRVGGAAADIFGLWGEPLAETREQITAIADAAASAGRSDTPRIWDTFRPIIAPTEELAWEKAHRILGQLRASNPDAAQRQPANRGSQRVLEIARRGEVHDRALWTATASATGARGASTALVGTPETVAAALLDYIDLGVSLISIRGYDNLNDAIDYGRHLLPLVREELAHRESVGAAR